MMKKLLAGCLTGLFMLGITSMAHAIPTLQLDITDGYYYEGFFLGEEESAHNSANAFELIALLDTTKPEFTDWQDYTYILSIALLPSADQVTPAPDFGSITIDTDLINVAGDMVYGNPPIASLFTNENDLPSHSVFDTYYTEIEFTFPTEATVGAYDVQTGESAPWFLHAKTFDVDVSGLDMGYAVHFDLFAYTTTTIYDVNTRAAFVEIIDVDSLIFAPFSHDATGAPIPEPATMLLFGTGLVGLAGVARRRSKK